MRVLLVNHRFFPAEGGTERWTLGLARALTKKGVKVTVLSQLEPNAPSEEHWKEGIDVVRIPVSKVGRFRVPRGYWRTLKGLDYDIFHLSGNRIWCADFYFPVAGLFPGPKVITPHDFYQLAMDPSPFNRWYFARYLPLRLEAFQGYLALTEREGKRITGFGYPREKVHVVGEGVDLGEMAGARPEDAPSVRGSRPLLALYVGGLWPNKRVDRLVKALAPHRKRVSLAVVGRDVPGSSCDQAHVASLAKSLGVEVRLFGPLPMEYVIAAYREADIFLLGSQYEGFGLALLEAMASGLPFLSYDVGAAPELARTGGGRVADDDEEFSRHLSELLSNDALRKEMGQTARVAAASWDWSIVIDGYLKVYNKLFRRA